jgi:hypothetical protein
MYAHHPPQLAGDKSTKDFPNGIFSEDPLHSGLRHGPGNFKISNYRPHDQFLLLLSFVGRSFYISAPPFLLYIAYMVVTAEGEIMDGN